LGTVQFAGSAFHSTQRAPQPSSRLIIAAVLVLVAMLIAIGIALFVS
jgi:hypothetical protein